MRNDRIRCLHAMSATATPYDAGGKVEDSGEVRLEEVAELLLELNRHPGGTKPVGEPDRLLVGVDKGQAPRAIREVLLQLPADGRLQPSLNVLIQELPHVTTSKHVGGLG